jgi:hypothetical protein
MKQFTKTIQPLNQRPRGSCLMKKDITTLVRHSLLESCIEFREMESWANHVSNQRQGTRERMTKQRNPSTGQ